MNELTKLCPLCKENKPHSAFYKARGKSFGISSQCKSCRKERYPWEPDSGKRSHLRNRYGLEWEDYVNLWHTQEKRCSICEQPIILHGKSSGDVAHVDHCHTTGNVRGLLCGHCNKGLGYFRDSLEVLKDAITYLERNSNGN